MGKTKVVMVLSAEGVSDMIRSQVIEDAMTRFCERLSASDVDSFEGFVSSDDATLVIGTTPGEWVKDRAALRFGFETEGMAISPHEPIGCEEGSLGWLIDEPTFNFPDGSSIKTRVTIVMHKEEGAWKILHMHASVGVPDEMVVELQNAWAGQVT